jgi:hypothetical protein
LLLQLAAPLLQSDARQGRYFHSASMFALNLLANVMGH